MRDNQSNEHLIPTATGVESLLYHNYHRENVLRSRLIPGIAVGDTTEGTMTCPRCQTQRDGIPHGAKVTCESCGLQMQRFGNSLDLLG